MHEETPESIIENIVTLPTIPSVLANLNAAVASPDSSAADVAAIISSDPPTATKVLRLANSAYYGLRNKVTTVNHAVTMLGFKIIRNLVLTATVFDESGMSNLSGLFEREDFWRHSLGVGIAARIVARESFGISGRQGDEFFICGLLHDVGKIIMAQFLHTKFEEALVVSRERHIPLVEAEKRVIGCTHAEVGGLLSKRWNLSDEITHALGYHHSPLSAAKEYIDYAGVIHVADFMARAKQIGSGGGTNPLLDRGAWNLLNLSKRKIPAVLSEIDKSLTEERLEV